LKLGVGKKENTSLPLVLKKSPSHRGKKTEGKREDGLVAAYQEKSKCKRLDMIMFSMEKMRQGKRGK